MRLLAAVAFIALLPLLVDEQRYAPVLKPVAVPIYVAPGGQSFDVPCAGGALLTTLDYFPQPLDTTYTLYFLADSGPSGGSVSLSLPLGYEQTVPVAPSSGQQPHTAIVQTPPYTGNRPVHIEVLAAGGACPSDMAVSAINIRAGQSLNPLSASAGSK